jgi:hypothetical protein
VSEIPGTLQGLWGQTPGVPWIGTKAKDKKMVTVVGLALSLFGASTEAKLFKAFTKTEIANGFVNRMNLFNVGRGALEWIKPKYEFMEFPKWLRDGIADAIPSIVQKPGKTFVDELGNKRTGFWQVGWGAGAEDRWVGYINKIRAMPSVEDRELWARAPENALRMATVVAVYRGSRTVDLEDLEWGLALVEYSVRQIKRGLDEHVLEQLAQGELVKKIRDEFRRAGRLKRGDINRLCERLTDDYSKIQHAIDHLSSIGDIVELERRGVVGRPTQEWEWISKK